MKKLFTVYDEKAEAYLSIFEARSSAEAVRSITAAANSQDSLLGKYPNDFRLMELGSFDEKTGTMEVHNGPVFVVRVGDLVQSSDQAPKFIRSLNSQTDLEEVIAQGNA